MHNVSWFWYFWIYNYTSPVKHWYGIWSQFKEQTIFEKKLTFADGMRMLIRSDLNLKNNDVDLNKMDLKTLIEQWAFIYCHKMQSHQCACTHMKVSHTSCCTEVLTTCNLVVCNASNRAGRMGTLGEEWGGLDLFSPRYKTTCLLTRKGCQMNFHMLMQYI